MPKKKTDKTEKADQPALPFDDTPATTSARTEDTEATAAPSSSGDGTNGDTAQMDQAPLAVSYRNWFLDYASYVILDRAVPHIDDGLKPVQRRVLHTLWDMDDGRFHKVANVVGATMKLHPHGDASIGADRKSTR